jgi:hypothetical protein
LDFSWLSQITEPFLSLLAELAHSCIPLPLLLFIQRIYQIEKQTRQTPLGRINGLMALR